MEKERKKDYLLIYVDKTNLPMKFLYIISYYNNRIMNHKDVVKVLKEVNENDINPDLIELTKKVLKNSLIVSKITKLNNAIENYDIPSCILLLEEINAMNINIELSLRERAEERIEESKRNPAAFAEKQKELQKVAGKTKKK